MENKLWITEIEISADCERGIKNAWNLEEGHVSTGSFADLQEQHENIVICVFFRPLHE